MDNTEKLSAWTEAERKVNTAERGGFIRKEEVCVSCSVMSDSSRPRGLCPPGFSIHGILQARILDWVAIAFSRGSSWPRDQAQVSRIAGRFFTVWASREALGFHYHEPSKEVKELCREVTKSITTELAQDPPGCSSGGCDCLLTHGSVSALSPTSCLLNARLV